MIDTTAKECRELACIFEAAEDIMTAGLLLRAANRIESLERIRAKLLDRHLPKTTGLRCDETADE